MSDAGEQKEDPPRVVRSGRVGGVSVGEWGEQGKRGSMEDRTVAAAVLRPRGAEGTYTFHAVFDGHGGDQAAVYSAKHLPGLVQRFLGEGGDVEDALAKAFVECDRAFVESTSTYAGTTAVAALVHHETRSLWIANAGDSRAVLCCRSGGKPKAWKAGESLSRDHKATLSAEAERVKAAGGFVINGRVMGELAVTRAIGDKEFSVEAPGTVVAEPEVQAHSVADGDAALVLACDGVFDVMTNDDVAAHVGASVAAAQHADAAAEDAAKALVNHAISDRNSLDNASAVIVLFHLDEAQ